MRWKKGKKGYEEEFELREKEMEEIEEEEEVLKSTFADLQINISK